MFNLFYLLTSFPHILGFVSRGTFDFFYLIPTIQRYNIHFYQTSNQQKKPIFFGDGFVQFIV